MKIISFLSNNVKYKYTVLTQILDINVLLFNFITYNAVKIILLLNVYGNNLVNNLYNAEILNCFKKKYNYIYENGCYNIVRLMLNDDLYIINNSSFLLLIRYGYFDIIKILNRNFSKGICKKRT